MNDILEVHWFGQWITIYLASINTEISTYMYVNRSICGISRAMTLHKHLHVASLFDICLTVASRVVAVGIPITTIPYVLYIKCLAKFAQLHGVQHPIPVRQPDLQDSSISLTPLIRTVSHLVLPRRGLPRDECILDMMVLMLVLCSQTTSIDDIIACLDHLADRLKHNPLLRILASAGLKACPIPRIRDALVCHGGKLDENDASYYIHAAGNSMYDVVKDAIINFEHDSVVGNERLTMLRAACYSGDVDMVRLCLDNNIGKDDLTESFLAALSRGLVDVCEVLATYHPFLLTDDRVWCVTHDINTAKWLVRSHAFLDEAVHLSAKYGHDSVVKSLVTGLRLPVPSDILPNICSTYPDIYLLDFLIDHGADVHVRDGNGNNVLHLAPCYAHYWIETGCNIDDISAVNSDHDTPMHVLCKTNDCVELLISVVKRLAITSCVLDVRDVNGSTVLALASSSGHLECVKCLVQHGANPNVMDAEGRTALDHAKIGCHGDVIEYLQSSGGVTQYRLVGMVMKSINDIKSFGVLNVLMCVVLIVMMTMMNMFGNTKVQ